jgi:hypothetical protein
MPVNEIYLRLQPFFSPSYRLGAVKPAMSQHEPTVPPQEPAFHGPSTQPTAVQARDTPAYEQVEPDDDEWLDESAELPRRPRRRLLTPLPLALIGVLGIACGFIGGVLVEKGQSSSNPSGSTSGSTSNLASRLAALSGGASSRSGAGAAASGALGALAGSDGSGGGGAPVAGQVTYVSGSTLYVTTSEGSTVKVTTSPATSVTKTVKASAKGIHPGETVTITGASAKNGALRAESIRVGAGGGGVAALLGGVSSGRGSSPTTGAGGGGGPSLFGNGG